MRLDVADGLGRVRAVPELVPAPFEPTGQLHVHGHDAPAEEDRRGGRAERGVAACLEDDTRRAVLAREPLPLRLAEHDGRAGPDDRQLLRRDLPARVAEDVRVLERDVGQDQNGGIQDVRRIEAPAAAPPRRRRRPRPPPRTPPAPRRSALRTASRRAARPPAGRARLHARSRPPCRLRGFARPNLSRAASSNRPSAAPRARASPRSSSSSSLSRSCRRCG